MSFGKVRNATSSADVSSKGYTSVLRDLSVNVTSLGIAHLVIKHSISPWFHQQAVALVGLMRLIYLLIYLFIIVAMMFLQTC
jgi:hypothetical protein